VQQNFLSQIGFRFDIKRLPNTSFFVQKVSLPGFNMSETPYPTPFKRLYLHGDQITYDDLVITVAMDEKMEVYKELKAWMEGLTKPNEFAQYKNIKESEFGLYSDASLVILNSKQNPALQVEFTDIFPTSLSALELDTTATSVEYIKCDIVFKHNGMKTITI
jgi:hypothetical protein